MWVQIPFSSKRERERPSNLLRYDMQLNVSTIDCSNNGKGNHLMLEIESKDVDRFHPKDALFDKESLNCMHKHQRKPQYKAYVYYVPTCIHLYRILWSVKMLLHFCLSPLGVQVLHMIHHNKEYYFILQTHFLRNKIACTMYIYLL